MMHKDELVKRLAATAGVSNKQAEDVLSFLCLEAISELKAGREFKLGELGKLSVKDLPARIGRNPRTGAPAEIPARKKVRFRAGKAVNRALGNV